MTIKNAQELKQLQSRKAKIEVSLKSLEMEAKEKQQACSKARNQLQAIKREIKDLQESDVIVTEHAMLRYLERAMGLDLGEIKKKILTEQNIVLIENMGSGKYPIGDGLKAVVKGRVVVSVA